MNSGKRGGADKEAGCFSAEMEEEELSPRPRAEFCPGQSVHSHIPRQNGEKEQAIVAARVSFQMDVVT